MAFMFARFISSQSSTSHLKSTALPLSGDQLWRLAPFMRKGTPFRKISLPRISSFLKAKSARTDSISAPAESERRITMEYRFGSSGLQSSNCDASPLRRSFPPPGAQSKTPEANGAPPRIFPAESAMKTSALTPPAAAPDRFATSRATSREALLKSGERSATA